MFSDILVKLLQQNNISAYKLAKDIGISETLVSNWKNGRQEPKYDNIQKLCKYFHVSADYLLELKDIDNLPLDENQRKLIDNYNKLNVSCQKHLLNYSAFMMTDPENLKNISNEYIYIFITHVIFF